MQEQDPNYGRPEESRLTQVSVGGRMSAQEERTWSIVAHLSVLANLITGIGGPVVALVMWLVYKDKSQRVAFHALQSLWYQVAWIVLLSVYTVISVVLIIVAIGVLMLFLLPLIALVPFVHQCYAAYKVSQGVDYRYPFIADLVDGGRRAA